MDGGDVYGESEISLNSDGVLTGGEMCHTFVYVSARTTSHPSPAVSSNGQRSILNSGFPSGMLCWLRVLTCEILSTASKVSTVSWISTFSQQLEKSPVVEAYAQCRPSENFSTNKWPTVIFSASSASCLCRIWHSAFEPFPQVSVESSSLVV